MSCVMIRIIRDARMDDLIGKEEIHRCSDSGEIIYPLKNPAAKKEADRVEECVVRAVTR